MDATQFFSLDSFTEQLARSPKIISLIYRGTTIDYFPPKPAPVFRADPPTHSLIYRGTTIHYPVFPASGDREPRALDWRYRI